MHGEPLYPADFSHFPYADPGAPRGGRLRIALTGRFDSLNPLIIKGEVPPGIREMVYESLMTRGADEPFTLYGLLAESIETPPGRNWAAFTLRKEARFSDGSPVRVEDVIFSVETLRRSGRPNHRFYYSRVAKAEKTGARRVRFTFEAGDNREMPLIMGLMPVISEKHFTAHPFAETSLEPPVGSGPYVIGEMRPGEKIVYRRNPDYWGRDLPAARGRFNIERIVYDYYRDDGTAFEAFRAGLADIRFETDPARWATGYEGLPVRRETLASRAPAGMWALVFNVRRGFFADPLVRRGLAHALDPDWANRNLFHGKYRRTMSFFDNSELSSHGRRADRIERELLEPFPGVVREEIMARGWQALPGGRRNIRGNRREALRLLGEAGFEIRKTRLVEKATGRPLRFTILTSSRREERLALIFADQWKRIGVDTQVRFADPGRMARLRQIYDYEMIFNRWGMSLSPGNEQEFYWSARAGRSPGSRNYPGVASAAADAMIAALTSARTRAGLIAAARALDRVLLSGDYVIPLFHPGGQWVAARGGVRWPEPVLYGSPMDTWWIEEGG